MIWILILFQRLLGQMQALRPRAALLSQNFRSPVVCFDKPFKWFRGDALVSDTLLPSRELHTCLFWGWLLSPTPPQLRAPCLLRHSMPNVLQKTLPMKQNFYDHTVAALHPVNCLRPSAPSKLCPPGLQTSQGSECSSWKPGSQVLPAAISHFCDLHMQV